MFPWRIRDRSASGEMSTTSTSSASSTTAVRDGLAHPDAGDAGDDVVEALEVLDVQRRDDVDAGIQDLVDVLPALLVLRARCVGVRQLVNRARPADGGR